MPFTTLLIDDEPAAHYALKELLKNHADTIQIAGEAFSGKEAISLCEKLKPELLFLDIRMPDMNGFEVLEQLSSQPYVIFSTAYDQYAIQAFNENSIDYLLKPIEEKRFEQCIHKLKRLNLKSPAINYTELNQLFAQLQKAKRKQAPFLFMFNLKSYWSAVPILHFVNRQTVTFLCLQTKVKSIYPTST